MGTVGLKELEIKKNGSLSLSFSTQQIFIYLFFLFVPHSRKLA